MKSSTILNMFFYYLLITPIIGSINGLSLHLLGISFMGPLFHTIFSMIIIISGLFSKNVKKNVPLIIVFSTYFFIICVLQLLLGFSDIIDLGQLYKWYFPILIFFIYYRWEFLSERQNINTVLKLFKYIPFVYASLIFISALAYYIFGFEATLFGSGAQRFTGFSFAYNPVVNALIICGIIDFIYANVYNSLHKLMLAIAFYFLRSKIALLYYGLIAYSYFNEMNLNKKKINKKLYLLIPVSVFIIWFGFQQSLTSSDLYDEQQGADKKVDIDHWYESVVGGRSGFVIFFIADFPDWPLINKIIGNGMNIDRRLLSSEFEALFLASYSNSILSKDNKNIELDLLGPIDMFGISGALIFWGVFYYYPLKVIKLKYFKLIYFVIIILSLYGGHVINNPQVAPLLVFAILFLAKLQSNKISPIYNNRLN